MINICVSVDHVAIVTYSVKILQNSQRGSRTTSQRIGGITHTSSLKHLMDRSGSNLKIKLLNPIKLTNLFIYLPSTVSTIRHQLVRNKNSIRLEFVCLFIFVTWLWRESSSWSASSLGITVFHCCVVHYDQYKDSWNLVFVWKFAFVVNKYDHSMSDPSRRNYLYIEIWGHHSFKDQFIAIWQ